MDNSICALTDSLLKNLNGQSQSKVSCDPKSLHCTRCCQTICVNVFVPKSVRQSPTFRHQTTSSLPLSPETIGFSSHTGDPPSCHCHAPARHVWTERFLFIKEKRCLATAVANPPSNSLDAWSSSRAILSSGGVF